MANFKLTQTKEQIQADLNLLDNNSATQGQVLTANGTGGASWQNAKGGKDGVNGKNVLYVIPNGTFQNDDASLNSSINSTLNIAVVTIGSDWRVGDNAIIPYYNTTCEANRIFGGEILDINETDNIVSISLKWFTN